MPAIVPRFTPLHRVATRGPATEWRREQGQAHAAFHREAETLRRGIASGKRAMPLVRNFLRHPKVRLAAALRALGDCPDREAALSLRDRVDAWAVHEAPINWYPKKKSSGGFRPICTLPPELEAVHHMLAAAILAQLDPSPALYGIAGRSRDDAARRLKDAQNEGYVRLAKTDIVNCFQSISPVALYQLPLPKEVIRRARDTRYMRFSRTAETQMDGPTGNYPYQARGSYHDHHNTSGPQGLMQGSPASPAILAWLLNGIPVGTDQIVILCFDNIVVAARDPDGCRAMVDTLADWLGRCSAGPLALCSPTYACKEPLDFLGYRFDPGRSGIGLADGPLDGFEKRLNAAETQDREERCEFPLRIWSTITDFAHGFPAIASAERELERHILSSEDNAQAGNWPDITVHLHRNLFAPRDSAEGHLIWLLLQEATRAKQRRKRRRTGRPRRHPG